MNKKNNYDPRFAALWRFGFAISFLNILGHTWLGFEQSWAQPIIAIVTAYTLELLFEKIDTWATGRTPRYRGGLKALASFLLPAHISALAVAMILYTNELNWPIIFGVAIAIGSKYILRVPTPRGSKHFLNPSNTGLALTFLFVPWISIAPPWQYTENVSGALDWIIPLILICAGTFLNYKFTGKHPLILGWLGGYVGQGIVRAILFDTPLASSLLPMTGLTFLLFTFYMISDPGTTPWTRTKQIAFGLAVAALYGVWVSSHIVFGYFYALLIVCTARGIWMYVSQHITLPERIKTAVPTTSGGD